jgi:ABC-type nitrate/sulfonate/bicarbonate transport system permease component
VSPVPLGPWRARLAGAALALILPGALLAAWEVLGAAGVLRPAFFPRPSALAGHAAALLSDGSLAGHARATLARLAWAFALAAVPGVGTGLAMGLSRRAREGLDPLFALIYPIPSVLFLPLLSFVLRAEGAALIVTAAITSFFLVAYTTMTGVQQIDRTVLEAAVHYGARGRRLFLSVLLPGALPHVFTGLRLGLGYTLIVVVAVEIAGAQRGLGALLWLSWEILKVEDMYVALAAIAVVGGVLMWALEAVRARVIPWARDPAGAGR